MRPRALPDARELAERRARRAERRRQRDRQQPEPAPNVPAPFDLPSNQELEQASRMIALPVAGRLVPVEITKPQEAKGWPPLLTQNCSRRANRWDETMVDPRNSKPLLALRVGETRR